MLVPLAACALLAAAAVVLSLRDVIRAARGDRAALESLLDLARGGDLERSIDGCRSQGGSLASLVAAGLESQRGRAARGGLREAVSEAGRLEAARLGHRLGLLKTIGRIAPLIGLLGTILGLIGVLQVASQGAAGTLAILAAQLGRTLVAAAAGVGVAVASVLAQAALRRRIEQHVAHHEGLSLRLLQRLQG